MVDLRGHAEYIPYAFQLLAQMLELHTSNIPGKYREIPHGLYHVDVLKLFLETSA
jgi:hypothetical protein